MNDAPVISAIIVSYNTRQMTLECLAALTTELAPHPHEIFVVDNASTDESPAAIRDQFPQVKLIPNESNVGFGAANNQAMKLAQGEYFLLINSDAFPKPGAIQSLVDYLKAHRDVALVGPRLLNADGSLQRSCYRFPSPSLAWSENLWINKFPWLFDDYSNWPHDTERQVDWVTGACVLLRKTAYQRVGGFDPRFFMYAEETDWQKRMREAGLHIAFTPSAKVTHLGGSSGANDKARINQSFFQSLDAYELKHHGVAGLLLLRLAMIIGCSMREILWVALIVVAPSRRQVAISKARMHLWLIMRQLTHWKVAN